MSDKTHCPKCGSELDTGFNCPKCGYKRYEQQESIQPELTTAEKVLLEYTDKRIEHKKTMYHIGCNLACRLRLKLISKRTFDRMWGKMCWLSVNLAAIEFKYDILTITINDSNFCHKYNIIKTINTAYDYAIKHLKKENKQ